MVAVKVVADLLAEGLDPLRHVGFATTGGRAASAAVWGHLYTLCGAIWGSVTRCGPSFCTEISNHPGGRNPATMFMYDSPSRPVIPGGSGVRCRVDSATWEATREASPVFVDAPNP